MRTRMTIQDIMMDPVVGIVHIVKRYAKQMSIDLESSERVQYYMRIVEARATGKLPTTAQTIRRFVRAHPAYLHDSNVLPAIACDLLTWMHQNCFEIKKQG